MSKPDLQTIVTHDFMQTSGGRVLLMGPKKAKQAAARAGPPA
jgi:hypothetical protein